MSQLLGQEGLHVLDLGTGAHLRVVPAPERPNTFGAEHLWAGQPIPAGSWLILGAADGTGDRVLDRDRYDATPSELVGARSDARAHDARAADPDGIAAAGSAASA